MRFSDICRPNLSTQKSLRGIKCNIDNFKTLQANRIVTIMLCAHRIHKMSVKFRFEISRYCKNLLRYTFCLIMYIVSSINLKVCCMNSGISGTNIFMIWQKWCHQNTRFCSWNGTNFNFGWGSATDPVVKLTTLPKVLFIGWLVALLWTLVDVCSSIINSFKLLVSLPL